MIRYRIDVHSEPFPRYVEATHIRSRPFDPASMEFIAPDGTVAFAVTGECRWMVTVTRVWVPDLPDLRVIQCNYAVDTKACAGGARAYVTLTNPGAGHDRIEVYARSRSGRWISKWEDIRLLRDFRMKTIPPRHTLYGCLGRAHGRDEQDVADLALMREWFSTHTATGALRETANGPEPKLGAAAGRS